MDIRYREDKDISGRDLAGLFLAVGWESGRKPEALAAAMRGAHAVYSAWAGERLVGLVHTLSDGALVASVQSLLVHPEFQNRGIGGALLDRVLERYAHLPRVVLSAFDAQAGFYARRGFRRSLGKTPMFLERSRS
jgi:GNAT superfamily N-acetyltransferase